MPAYVATPEGEVAGGVLVVQEAFGITTHIQSICRRLADAGYAGRRSRPTSTARVARRCSTTTTWSRCGPVMMALTAEGIRADIDAALSIWRRSATRGTRWAWSASAWAAASPWSPPSTTPWVRPSPSTAAA